MLVMVIKKLHELSYRTSNSSSVVLSCMLVAGT